MSDNLDQGSDRDILNAIDTRVQLMRDRDAKAINGDLGQSLQTCERLIPSATPEIDQAFTNLQNFAKTRLAMKRS